MESKIILLLLELCSIVYKSYSEVNSFLEKLGFNKVTFFNYSSGLQAVLAVKGDDIYITFRGSSELDDFKTDYKFLPKKFLNVLAHRGFVKSFSECEADLIDYTLSNLNVKSKIFVAGHSLGGALATLAVAHLNNKKFSNQIALVTFGCPKVFYNIFEPFKLFSGVEIHRFVNGDDLVPTLPPKLYKHISEEVLLQAKDKNGKLNEHSMESYRVYITDIFKVEE